MNIIISIIKFYNMISHCKLCVRDDLWEYEICYGTYNSELQLENVLLHLKFFETKSLKF